MINIVNDRYGKKNLLKYNHSTNEHERPMQIFADYKTDYNENIPNLSIGLLSLNGADQLLLRIKVGILLKKTGAKLMQRICVILHTVCIVLHTILSKVNFFSLQICAVLGVQFCIFKMGVREKNKYQLCDIVR